MRSLAKIGLILCFAPFASPVLAEPTTPAAEVSQARRPSAPSPVDSQAIMNSYAMADQFQAFLAKIRELENARQKLKVDGGRFTRADRIELEAKLSQLDHFIMNNRPQEAADLFREAVNAVRTAYFNYVFYSARIARLGMEVEAKLITPEFAAQRIEMLTEQREIAIHDMGYYRSDFIEIIRHLDRIQKNNELSAPEPALESMAIAIHPSVAKEAPTFAKTANTIRDYLFTAKNIKLGFSDLEQLKGISEFEQLPEEVKRLEGPDKDQTGDIFWQEPYAQIASLERDLRREESVHTQMKKMNYRLITMLKGFVDSTWVPTAFRVFLHDFFQLSIDRRSSAMMRPLILMILDSKSEGLALIDELFELNASTRNDDELLVSFSRVAKSPPGRKRNIKELWYNMKRELKAKDSELQAEGFKQNPYGDRLQRMEDAEAYGRKLKKDFPLVHEARSPMEARQTCQLALLAGTGTAAAVYYKNMDWFNDKAVSVYHTGVQFVHWAQTIQWPF